MKKRLRSFRAALTTPLGTFLFVGLVVQFGTLLFSPTRSPLGSRSAYAQVAGVDYVQGQVVLTFSKAYMPAEQDVSTYPPRVGIAVLDGVFTQRGASYLRKLVPSFNRFTSEEGGFVERTFLLYYDAPIDAKDVVTQLEQFPFFEFVGTNDIAHVEPLGTVRFVPGSDTTAFGQQWYLDDDNGLGGDSADIDMPEAWAIERGDPNLIVGIYDTGTMLDTTTDPSNWKKHSDFNFHWNSAEDVASPNVLNGADLNDVDNDVPPDLRKDNIIGTRYLGCPGCPTGTPQDLYKKRFWHALPHNWHTEPFTGATSWDAGSWSDHGVRVGSIAAAKLDGVKPQFGLGYKDIVGIAQNCKVYNVRFSDNYFDLGDALLHLAGKARVINMSIMIVETLPGGAGPVHWTNAIVTASKDLDCVLIAANGNKGPLTPPNTISYPAKFDSVLAVGAIMRDPVTLTYYSKYDVDEPLVDVVAPVDLGIIADKHSDCPGTYPCSITEVIGSTTTGTSFAAPQASGIAALIRSRFPGLNQFEVKQRIKKGAEFYWSSDPAGVYKYGKGKVNAYRSLTEYGRIHPSPVGKNITWSASAAGGGIYSKDGIFYLSGDFTIDLGDTLTINKGVTIKVAPDHETTVGDPDPTRVQIVVKGTLRTGTGTGDIVFQSFTDVTGGTRSDWVGIKFEATSTNNVLDGVTIRNAQVGIENHAPVTLTNSIVQECVRGIEVDTAITIQTCTIEACDISGVDISSVGIVGQDSAYIDGTTIRNVAGKGINLRDKGKLRLTNSTIDNAGNGIEVSSGAKLYASSNTLFQNNYIGVRIYAGTPAVPLATAELVFCDIKNNNTGIEAEGISGVTVKSCLISGNTVQGVSCKSGAAIELRTNNIKNSPIGVFCDNSAPKIRRGNTIKLNSMGIKCVNFSNAVVESTTIDSNGKGVTALSGSNPELGRETANPPSKGYNAIENDTTYSVGNYTSIWIKAEKNYWGPGGPYPSSRFVGLVDRFPFLPGKPENGPPPYEDPGEAPVFQPSDEVPMVYGISNGYPNPFNPATRLNYEVPRPGGHVLITVFNVKGQRVATLADKQQAPGFYTATWDGKSDGGTDIATGVYFVQMRAANFTKTRKLVFLK